MPIVVHIIYCLAKRLRPYGAMFAKEMGPYGQECVTILPHCA
jgi:hypothetical protein